MVAKQSTHENQALYSIIVYSKSFFFSDWLKSRGLFFIISWRWPNLEEVLQLNCQKIDWKPGSLWSRLCCFGGELQNDGTFFTFRKEKMAELLPKIIARWRISAKLMICRQGHPSISWTRRETGNWDNWRRFSSANTLQIILSLIWWLLINTLIIQQRFQNFTHSRHEIETRNFN